MRSKLGIVGNFTVGIFMGFLWLWGVILVLARVTDTANYCKQYQFAGEMGAWKQPTSLNEP